MFALDDHDAPALASLLNHDLSQALVLLVRLNRVVLVRLGRELGQGSYRNL